MAIQGHVFWSLYKGDKGLSNTIAAHNLALFVIVADTMDLHSHVRGGLRKTHVCWNSV